MFSIDQISAEKTKETAAAEDPSAPDISAWVSAHAGAGKTYLLVSRLKRLLLSGVAPSRIVCITYTKTGAAEMNSRLMQELAEWVWLPEAQLKEKLRALGEPTDEDVLKRARMLFPLLTDDPVGLRMVTLHSFCQSLLGRFPIEAGIEPYFEVIDERRQWELLSEALQQVMLRSGEVAPHLAEAIGEMAGEIHETSFYDISKLLMQHGQRFRELFETTNAAEAIAHIYRYFEIDPTLTPSALFHHHYRHLDDEWTEKFRAIIAAFQEDGGKKALERLQGVPEWVEATHEDYRLSHWDDYSKFFLTSAGTVRSSLIPAKAKKQLSDDLQTFVEDECTRLEEYMEASQRLGDAQYSAQILTIVAGVYAAYGSLKRSRALLDYDDMIAQSLQLLRNEGAAWVMYKLDEGIDHVLVDEAQDTSREQWEIVHRLTEEYFAGHGTQHGLSSLFVVGDNKQSIFSFQGAYPEGLNEWHSTFRQKARDARRAWVDGRLEANRRSVAPVLSLVDEVCNSEDVSLAETTETVLHNVHRAGDGGLVELWPLVPHVKKEHAERWQVASERQQETGKWNELAAMIADTIAGWLEQGERLESTDKPIQPEDILILVQRRGEFMGHMIRALQERGVPVSGVDRLVLSESLVAKDLLSAAKFALLPDDDYNLACLLKSPICDVRDAILEAIAATRPKGQSLWSALLQHGEFRRLRGEVIERLQRLLAMADYTHVYEFFTQLLENLDARRRIVGRMGEAQQDIIEEFLNTALLFEQNHAPSLQAFCQWMEEDASYIKRNMSGDQSVVRLMTVHGAKGLEAPIVFLPDSVATPRNASSIQDKLYWTGGAQEIPVYCRKNAEASAPLQRLLDQAKRKQEQEYYRLLYVALTRARDRLYVCGVEGGRSVADKCWYTQIKRALERLEASEPCQTPTGEGIILKAKQSRVIEADSHTSSDKESAAIDPSILQRLDQPLPTEEKDHIYSPSRLNEDEVIIPSPPKDNVGYSRGTLIHRLLQYMPALPEKQRQGFAESLLAMQHDLPEAEQKSIISHTLRLFDHPDYAHLFTSLSYAEVPLIGTVEIAGKKQTIAGQVDRLVILDDEVWVIDYKTHAPSWKEGAQEKPVPTAYLNQMQAYHALLAQIYPQKTVRTALLWTSIPLLQELDIPR